MLRGTWYYNKEIKVENVAESAKIVTLTNIPLMKGTVPKRLDICYDFGTFSNILNFYFLIVYWSCMLLLIGSWQEPRQHEISINFSTKFRLAKLAFYRSDANLVLFFSVFISLHNCKGALA